jgi:flavin reductase (DIM6/NTAB) family NADH-FMN oxidoreductase RutF
MEPRTSFEFRKNWWPAPVTLISCGVNRPEAKRGANIWVVGVLGGPCDDPPLLTISPRVGMYSYKLLAEVGQFVVNFPTPQMVREMEYCGTHTGVEVDKWKACGFTPIKGTIVDVPLIAECPVNIECVIEQQIRFERDDGEDGEHELMIGRIVHVNAHSKYMINGELQWDLVDTIYRARPRTWRTLGPVLGYDARKEPLAKPQEAAELVNRRVATFNDLADDIRRTPYPTQVATDLSNGGQE